MFESIKKNESREAKHESTSISINPELLGITGETGDKIRTRIMFSDDGDLVLEKQTTNSSASREAVATTIEITLELAEKIDAILSRMESLYEEAMLEERCDNDDGEDDAEDDEDFEPSEINPMHLLVMRVRRALKPFLGKTE